MSIWHPASGVSYSQYLQADSFIKDINGQIKSSSEALQVRVSDQTKALVASNEQLTEEFGKAFNSVNSTLEWGFNKLENALQDVNTSIYSLHADFNYNMGLLLEEAHTHNRLLNGLLGKLDAIHKTLETPTLTQAREFYRIGCERLSKGLLDKALEAFIEADKKNDTDFFTHFQIGKLYLYGIDEDDNVLDLEKAKKHLLLASRYAKAEITVDASFAQFAAEALLHASIAVYVQLGEKNVFGNSNRTKQLLEEAKHLASDAIKIYPHLSESFYHVAKYSSLLSEPQIALPNLESALAIDRNYAIKVDIDRAFDPIRPHVVVLLSKLKDARKVETLDKLQQISHLLGDVSLWHPEESNVLASEFSKCKENLSKAQEHFNSQTYFGYLDAILLLEQLTTSLPLLKSKRMDELKYLVDQSIRSAQDKLPRTDKYSLNVANKVRETNDLISQAQVHMSQGNYEALKVAFEIAQAANLKAASSLKMSHEEDEAAALQVKRNEWSKNYAYTGAWILGIIGAYGGCYSFSHNGSLNFITGIIIGAIVGAIIGAVIGQMKKG